MNDNKSWLIFAILSAFFAALTTILAKVGVEGVNSNLATALRTVVILVIAWALVYAEGTFQGLFELNQKTLLFLVLSGIATGLSWLCYFRALQLGPASLIAPIDKSSLLLISLLSVVFLGEPMTSKMIMGTGLILFGTLVLIR
ncbi:MAG: EamA family transporter [Cyanobacteria bacterium P01_G01_bin.39]